MARSRFLSVCALSLLLLCMPVAASHCFGGPTGEVLCVSDIHFDPLQGLDGSVAKKLMQTNYKNWYTIYAKHERSKGGYGSQTNFPLLDSAFKQMREVCAKPDYILFSGDLLAHGIRSRYKYILGNNYQALIRNTINFIGYEFNHYFPGVPIYFTLGNNDHYLDYGFAPNDVFFRDTGNNFFKYYLKGNSAAQSAFDKSFREAGNYSFQPPASPQNRIIALNNCFFSSSKYNKHQDESAGQLKWLDSELASARKKGERVWILMHIPPGVEVKGTLDKGQAISYWVKLQDARRSTLLERFRDLVAQYSPEIAGIFSGHTHMDHFRLILDAPVPKSLVHITPALSPQFGNNPAFQVLRYDRQSFDVIDYDAYRYGYQNGWAKEYTLNAAFKTTLYDPANMQKVFEGIQTDTATRKFFTDFYNVKSTQFTIASKWKAYWCGITGLTPEDFDGCYPPGAIWGTGN